MNDRRHERGALMVGLMAAVAIMLIVSTVAFQSWEDVIRRDKEAEMIFRAQEIARALKRYQTAQGAPPTELKKLMEKTGTGQYVLRRLYTDPLVKDGKWGLLFLAPGGGIFDPNAEDAGGGLDANGQPVAGNPSPFSNPGAQTGQPAGSQQQQPGTSSLFGQQAGSDGGGQQGLPIAGVRSLCTDKPFRVFREQTEYDKWLFTLNDLDLLGPVPGQKGIPNNPGTGLPGNPNTNMNPGAGGPTGGGFGTPTPDKTK